MFRSSMESRQSQVIVAGQVGRTKPIIKGCEEARRGYQGSYCSRPIGQAEQEGWTVAADVGPAVSSDGHR